MKKKIRRKVILITLLVLLIGYLLSINGMLEFKKSIKYKPVEENGISEDSARVLLKEIENLKKGNAQ